MEIELFEIRDHLFSHAPFRNLPRHVVDELVPHIEVAYHQAGTMVLEKGQENHFLFFIRGGAVEILRSSGELYTQMGEGECFGQFSLLRKKQVRYAARAIEDTLVYKIPDVQFQNLADTYDEFADFMEEERSIRLKNALGRAGQEHRNPLMISKIHKLIHREIVTASAAVSIQQAAVIMTENRVSSLILVPDSPEPDRSPIVGLITDRDLRKRAVARGLPLSTPVREIMSTEIITLQAAEYAFEAMLTMMRHNLHHLPVLEGSRPVGVITVADLVRYESHGSVYLVGDIFRQNAVAGLAAMAPKIKQLFVQLANEDASSQTIGAAISRMGISISQRLVQLGEKQLGPPPIPYCLLALGSMARDEMTLVADQDNAFVLDDAFDRDRHDSYFKALAQFLSDGLDRCGYPYCTGDIMATNTQWRQPLSAWKTCFTDWIDHPEPEALLHASIFFDLEGIYGETGFAGRLKKLIRVKETALLAEGVGDDLIDALELIAMVRIRHQAHQAESGIPVDNNVTPESLSAFERNHLKDAFQVVSQAQSFLKYRYNVSPAMQPGIGSKQA